MSTSDPLREILGALCILAVSACGQPDPWLFGGNQASSLAVRLELLPPPLLDTVFAIDPLSGGEIMSVTDAAISPDGRVVLADVRGPAVHVYDPDGSLALTLKSKGTAPGSFLAPMRVAASASGFHVFDGTLGKLASFDWEGSLTRVREISGVLSDLESDPDGPVLIASARWDGHVTVIDGSVAAALVQAPPGQPQSLARQPLGGQVCATNRGFVYASPFTEQLVEYDPSGEALRSVLAKPPRGVAMTPRVSAGGLSQDRIPVGMACLDDYILAGYLDETSGRAWVNVVNRTSLQAVGRMPMEDGGWPRGYLGNAASGLVVIYQSSGENPKVMVVRPRFAFAVAVGGRR